nr:hypothetical protein [Tanacetum cinerariifolium]
MESLEFVFYSKTVLVKAFHACKQEDGQSVSSYLLKKKSYLDTLERLGYAMPNELAELYSMLKLHEKCIPKNAKTLVVLAIQEGKIHKDKKKLQGAKGKVKVKNKLSYAPKAKILPPPKRDNLMKDSICHHFKEVKDNKEEDKIRAKPDKIKNKREAWKSPESSRQIQSPVKVKKASK